MSNDPGDDRALLASISGWFAAEPLWHRALGALREHGAPAYLVGGSVRDALRGRPGHDMDVAVPGEAISLGRWLADRLGGAFYPMDREHDVARIVFNTQAASYHIDLAGLRGKTILEDLALRDFTVNAMGMRLSDPFGPLLDPTGGRADLEAGVLRMAYPDALRDDPVRLLRGLRLSAALGLRLHPETRAQIRRHAPLLHQVSPERVRDEFLAMLSLPSADPIAEAHELGLLPLILPTVSAEGVLAGLGWLEALRRGAGLERIRAAYGQALDAAWQRPMVEARRRIATVSLAALLATAPADDLAGLGARLRLSGREWGHLRGMLGALRAALWEQNAPGLNRGAAHAYYRRYGEAGVDAAVLATCQPGGDPACGTKAAYLLWAWFEAHDQIVAPPRLLQGGDLLREFGLEPGPHIGQLMDALSAAQAEGRIHTADQARAYVHEYLMSESAKGSRV